MGSGRVLTPSHAALPQHVSAQDLGPGGTSAVARALAGELRRSPWYELPCLYTVHAADGRCRLRRLEVPARAWPVLGMTAGLRAAVAVAARPGYRPPDGLLGAALRLEEWHLPPGMPEEERDAAGFPGPRRRVMRRAMHAADLTGTAYLITQQDGTRLTHRSISQPGGAPAAGTIADALRFLAAVLGSGPPPPARHGPEPAR